MSYNADSIQSLSNFSNINTKVKGKIYIITNSINDKKYIGQTRESLTKRFNRHCRNYRDQEGSIDYDILLYEKDFFKIDLIEEVPIEELDEREKYWIKYYDSYKNGYNRTIGGSRGGLYTQEELQNAIEMYYQNFPLKEIKNKIGISRSTITKYINNNNLPKKKITEHQIKSNINNVKKATLAKQIPIKNISLNISYSSKKEALKDMIEKGYSKAKDWHNIRSGLDKALKNKELFLNFKWEYINE